MFLDEWLSANQGPILPKALQINENSFIKLIQIKRKRISGEFSQIFITYFEECPNITAIISREGNSQMIENNYVEGGWGQIMIIF